MAPIKAQTITMETEHEDTTAKLEWMEPMRAYQPSNS